MKIGAIGIGSMGAPMAQNLARDSDSVLAFDIAVERVDAITMPGLARAESVTEIAEKCELIILMTPDDKALRDVIYGDAGILSVASFAGCVVDLSTTSEILAREIAKSVIVHGAGYLDGAVIGGGVTKAREGTSPVIVSGDKSLFKKYKSKLERLGSVDYAGKQGNAKIVKICNNLLLGINTVSGAEALSIGESAGLTIEDMTRWLDDSSGNSAALQGMFGHFVQTGTFPEGVASLRFYDKDMSLGCDLAERNEFPAFFTHLTRQILATAAQIEGKDAPFPSVLTYYRAMQYAATESDVRN